MSLHALAGHMATKGRNGDSMLVHMTPGEVQALQALAERHGGTLTINPETGQPEANFLKKMLPMIAGLALAPLTAGTSLAFLGATPLASALTVGGITGLATGSLSRGLMAGLGAYGGASLGAGLSSAGTGAIAATDIAAQQAAGTFPTLAEGAGAEQIAKYATDVSGVRDAALSKAGEAGLGSKLSQGLGQMASNPGAYTKDIMQAGLAAISPMMADQGVQTTTKRPDTGTIRNYTFDPYGQTYTSTGNYPASEYKGMAQGGIVAFAKGGVSDQDVQNWFATNTGANDAQIAAAMQQFNVAPEQIARVTGVGMPDVQQRYETAIAPQIVGTYTGGVAGPGGTTATRGTGYLGIQDQLENAGVTAQELFNNPNYKGWSQPELEQAYNVANKIQQFDTGANSAALDDKAWANFMDTNKFSVRNIAQATGLSEEEVQRRYDAAKTTTKQPITNTLPVITGNTQGPGTQGGISDLTNVGSDELPSGISGISGAGQIGGGTVVNPNGTITTSPRIPGIPVGGFTGMQNLRDVYTERGGSLGYVNPAPKTVEEFEQRFNKQTGDSLAAYNYLMGKGANPIKSGVGEIMRPYSEAVRGIPAEAGRPNQKYVYENGRYVENPNYRPVTYDSKGNRTVGMTSNEVLKGFQALPNKTDDSAIFDWVNKNKVSIAQLAAAMGVSVAEAQRRMDAVGNKKTDETPATDNMPGGAANGGVMGMALGGLGSLAGGGQAGYNLGGYSDGGRLLKGPGDGVSDSIPASIGRNRQPARLADGEFVVPARIVSELGNGSTEAGARKLYAMMDRVQKARGKTTGKSRVAADTRAEKYLPA